MPSFHVTFHLLVFTLLFLVFHPFLSFKFLFFPLLYSLWICHTSHLIFIYFFLITHTSNLFFSLIHPYIYLFVYSTKCLFHTLHLTFHFLCYISLPFTLFIFFLNFIPSVIHSFYPSLPNSIQNIKLSFSSISYPSLLYPLPSLPFTNLSFS